MQNAFCKWRGKLFMLYLPNSTSALIDGQFRGHKKDRNTNHTRMRWQTVSRNLAWQLLTSVSSLPCCLPQWKYVGASFAALALHLENRWFSSPPGFLFCCNKKPISFFILHRNSWLQVCPAVVPLVPLPSRSIRADMQNLTHLQSGQTDCKGVWTTHPPALSVNHSGPGSCPQTWLLQRQWKGWIVLGVLSSHLAAVWFWQNLGIF